MGGKRGDGATPPLASHPEQTAEQNDQNARSERRFTTSIAGRLALFVCSGHGRELARFRLVVRIARSFSLPPPVLTN